VVAGLWEWDDALRLVARHAALMQRLPEGGGMAAARGDEAVVRVALARRTDRLAIVAVNGSRVFTLSGEAAALAEVLDELRSRGVVSKRLDVSHAFHSPLREPMLPELQRLADAVPGWRPMRPLCGWPLAVGRIVWRSLRSTARAASRWRAMRLP
jgi:acyl transferase domain-containing protein